MIKRLWILLFATALLFPHVSLAACKPEEKKAALQSSSDLQNWDDVYAWFNRFSECDSHSGESGESLSDAVVVLFAQNWKAFPRFVLLSGKNPAFKKFVLSYIGSTADIDDLRKAKKNAETHCPKNAKPLCREVKKELTLAIQDSEKPHD